MVKNKSYVMWNNKGGVGKSQLFSTLLLSMQR